MKISLFGLGIIGSIWSRHWIADGHEVRTWNRSAKPDFPGWTANPAEAAMDAELIVITVTDGPATLSVIDQISSSLKPGMVVVNNSTIGVDETQLLAQRVRAMGAAFCDLPFVGSKPAAESRQHVFYLGDDDHSFPKVEAAYKSLSKAIIPIGKVGQAMSLKLILNLLVAETYQALAESLHLARCSGIETEQFYSVLDLHVCRSGLSELKRPLLTSGNFSPQFSVRNMHKDLKLALGLAEEYKQDLPVAKSVVDSYAKAQERGLGELDFSALIEGLKR